MFKTGDRVLIPRYGEGTVCAVRHNGDVTVWADSQDCEFDHERGDVKLIARATHLSPAEVEAIEVFADGTIHLLGDHSQRVMCDVLKEIAKRSK